MMCVRVHVSTLLAVVLGQKKKKKKQKETKKKSLFSAAFDLGD